MDGGANGGFCMGVETLLGAGASLVGGMLQSDAAGDAADAQAGATAASIAEQRRQFDLTRGDYAPYRAIGTNALRRLGAFYGVDDSTQAQPGLGAGLTEAQIQMDPGYEFGRQQGEQALNRKIAAAGGRVSGASLKAAQRFGTDYATTGYSAAYGRRQDRENRLAALAGIGQTATAGSASAGQNATNAISQALQSQGDATAAAGMARGNIWSNALNQGVAAYNRRPWDTAGYGTTGGFDTMGFGGVY